MTIWPDREEWGAQRRTPYADMFEFLGVSRCASDYATAGEIGAVISALKALYADEGRKLRAARLAAGPLGQQPGETRTARVLRYYRLSESERGALLPVWTHEQHRKDINEAIKALRDDTLPAHRSWDAVEAILAPMEARWQAAHTIAHEARRREIEATPIDDAAWARELRWRRELDGRHGAPGGCSDIPADL
jgi:hypothetical protein